MRGNTPGGLLKRLGAVRSVYGRHKKRTLIVAKVQNVFSLLINEPVSKLQVNPSPDTVLRPWKRIYIDLLLLFVTVVWGSTFLVTKYMLDVVGLFTYLGYNFGVGTLTLVLIFHKRFLRITRTQLLQR